MKEVLAFIEVKKHEFSQLPLFKFMQDRSIDPRQRLGFAPCISPFAMNFGDFNKYVLRENNPTSRIQELINIHTYEDDHHWLWFLKDLEKLGFNHSLKFNDALKFMWSEETKKTRLVCNKIAQLYSPEKEPLLRLSISEAIEATGHVILFNTAEVIKDLEPITQQKYSYFGLSHFAVETGYPMGTENVEEYILSLELTEETRMKAFELVEKVFDAFTEVIYEFEAYLHTHTLDQPFSISPFRKEKSNEHCLAISS